MTEYTEQSKHRLRHHGEGDLDTWFPVNFCERTIIAPGAASPYRYSGLRVPHHYNARDYLMNFPPMVGDWIYLAVEPVEESGMFRVIDRYWQSSGYGSDYWPYGERTPVTPHKLELIVVRSKTGPYRLEAELTEEELKEYE